MENVLSRIVECVATTTRYPKQLLVADADLENDLGIDSVKRVEIVAALADEFGLDLISQERDLSIRTIEHIAHWIESLAVQQASTSEDSEPGEIRMDSVSAGHEQSPPNAEQAAHDRPSNGFGTAAFNDVQRPTRANQNGHAGKGNANGHANGNGSERLNGHTIEANGHASPGPGFSLGQVNHYSSAHADLQPKGAFPKSTQTASAMSLPMTGRVALVTGSGRGVGRTIARVLAARGATVVINSFHSRDLGDQTAAEINASGGTAIHIWGSVANPQQVDGMFEQLEQQVGYLDMLICNASDGRIGSFSEISHEDWDRAFRTNVSGHHQCSMRASQLMQRRGGGSIVTMSSIAAHRFVEGLGGQGVIKAAVESLTRHLACELAPFGIRTNCVSGGPVYGDLISNYPEARATHNYWESIIPDGEMCSPMDLANTIAFLLSDEARAVNGAVWTVDHGASTRAHSRPLPQSNGAVCCRPRFS